MNLMNLLAFIFAVYFLIAFTLVHLIKKEYLFKKDALSEYAVGKWGFIITIAFFVIAFNQFLLSWKFFQSNHFFPSLFLALSGLGVLIVAIVKVHKRKDELLKIHDFGAAMQFIFFPLALISYFIFSRNAFFTLVIGLITFIFIFILRDANNKYDRGEISNFGLIEKINILLINSWLIVISYLNVFY